MKIGFPKKRPTNDNARPPGFWLATAFGAGLLRPAPGTWGSLAAIPPGLLILHFAGPFALAAALLAVAALSFPTISAYQKHTGTHDDSRIVIDEVLGMGIALLCSGTHPILVLIAFALFRFFDIVKPGPVGWLDRNLKGATGVICDDLLAGLFAGICTGIIRYAPTIS